MPEPARVLHLPVLRPPDGDLVVYAWTLLRRYQERTGARTRLRVSSRWPQFPGPAAAALYRLLEEVLREGAMRRADVQLDAEGDHLLLILRSEGLPPDDREVARLDGWATANEGQVLVQSEGQDTTLRAAVPASAPPVMTR